MNAKMYFVKERPDGYSAVFGNDPNKRFIVYMDNSLVGEVPESLSEKVADKFYVSFPCAAYLSSYGNMYRLISSNETITYNVFVKKIKFSLSINNDEKDIVSIKSYSSVVGGRRGDGYLVTLKKGVPLLYTVTMSNKESKIRISEDGEVTFL